MYAVYMFFLYFFNCCVLLVHWRIASGLNRVWEQGHTHTHRVHLRVFKVTEGEEDHTNRLLTSGASGAIFLTLSSLLPLSLSLSFPFPFASSLLPSHFPFFLLSFSFLSSPLSLPPLPNQQQLWWCWWCVVVACCNISCCGGVVSDRRQH